MGDADRILERKVLNKQLFIWRVLAITMIFAIFSLIYSRSNNFRGASYIASISVIGEIFENADREKNLARIAEDPNIKAVIFNITSPGGSSYGGESLYGSILEISKRKPVVAVMGTLATSAGYMASLAANHIIARNSTITSSIGAIFISPEFSELAQKLGVNFIVLKKGRFKAEPLPFKGPITPEAKQMIGSLLDDQYNMFFAMVAKHRKIPKSKLMELADGQLLTGSQALRAGLIDQIGSNKEAMEWLAAQNIDVEHLKVQEIPLYETKGFSLLTDLKSMILSATSFLKMFASTDIRV
jgi:protease-4